MASSVSQATLSLKVIFPNPLISGDPVRHQLMAVCPACQEVKVLCTWEAKAGESVGSCVCPKCGADLFVDPAAPKPMEEPVNGPEGKEESSKDVQG